MLASTLEPFRSRLLHVSRSRFRSFLLGAAASLTQLTPLQAAPSAATEQHFDLERHSYGALGLETAAVGSLLAASFLLVQPAPARCHWCKTNAFDRAVRDALRADQPRGAGYVSHGLSLGAVPALSIAGLVGPAYGDGKPAVGAKDVWIMANAMLLTTAVGTMTKRLVGRQRPAFHYLREDETTFADYPAEENQSFFSLDTAWAFAAASSGTTLAYLHGYSTAPYVLAGGGLLALSTGTLRIVADAHWATDVLTGAFVGTGIGIALPCLVHPRKDRSPAAADMALVPLGGGPGLALSGVF